MTSLRDGLGQFHGSTTWFRHSFNKAVIYTEGIQYLMEHGNAYWLVDAIASHTLSRAFNEAATNDDRIHSLHFWKLAVKPDHSALLTAVADSGEPPFIEQAIEYTDFPLDAIDIWSAHNGEGYTLMLPGEY